MPHFMTENVKILLCYYLPTVKIITGDKILQRQCNFLYISIVNHRKKKGFLLSWQYISQIAVIL